MKALPAQTLVDNKLLVLIVIILIINTVMVGVVFSLGTMGSGEAPGLDKKKAVAQDLVAYNESLAVELEVIDNAAVREDLARFSYEISEASTGEELSKIILSHGRSVQETILREWDNKMREQIVLILNENEEFQSIDESIRVTLSVSEEGALESNPAGILGEEVMEEIQEMLSHQIIQELSLEVEIKEGEAIISAPYNPLDHIESLVEEIDSLRVSLHETRETAGLTELSGSGIRILLDDVPGDYTDESVIHDADVRDLINELFASGARGVAVGGERMVATSAIRCVGPVVEVNGRKIPSSPMVIEAVGDPEVLKSGLDIIGANLERNRGLQLEVEEMEELTLPAYSG